MGEDGLEGLSPSARALLDGAEAVFGGERHLAFLPKTGKAERLAWPSPFSAAREAVLARRGRRVAVLASGDPMWFGVGATLTRWLEPGEMTVIPHPGAFSLAAARLGWPLQDCLCLTAHGRPLAALAVHFAPGRRLLVLSEDGGTPAKLAELLQDQGYGSSCLTVLEHLGGPAERVAAWTGGGAADLNTIAVELALDPGRRALSTVPGLPDDAFLHDGQLTKREVRAVTLAALAPLPGRLLWDVGAGSGSVAIEWMRAGGRAVAIEPQPERLDRIARNTQALGVPSLEIVAASAPEGLVGLAQPDAVFVGGGVSRPGVLEACWAALPSGGRLVANGVTAEAEAALLAFRECYGGDMTRIAVSRLAPVGGFHGWHPLMPVTQYAGWKP